MKTNLLAAGLAQRVPQRSTVSKRALSRRGSGGFRNTISLDQYMAERVGHLTRFQAMTLGVNVQRGQRSLSWTASGVMIPCEEKASDVFKRMFVQGTPKEVEQQVKKLEL